MHAGKRGVIELNVIFAVLFAKYSLASPLEAHLFKEKKFDFRRSCDSKGYGQTVLTIAQSKQTYHRVKEMQHSHNIFR